MGVFISRFVGVWIHWFDVTATPTLEEHSRPSLTVTRQHKMSLQIAEIYTSLTLSSTRVMNWHSRLSFKFATNPTKYNKMVKQCQNTVGFTYVLCSIRCWVCQVCSFQLTDACTKIHFTSTISFGETKYRKKIKMQLRVLFVQTTRNPNILISRVGRYA